MVVITPEGAIWDAYDQTFPDNERSMTNKKGELRPPMYKYKECVGEDDYGNINSILVIDINVNRHDMDAVIAANKTQDVDFQTEKELNLGYHMNVAAVSSIKPFSLD